VEACCALAVRLKAAWVRVRVRPSAMRWLTSCGYLRSSTSAVRGTLPPSPRTADSGEYVAVTAAAPSFASCAALHMSRTPICAFQSAYPFDKVHSV